MSAALQRTLALAAVALLAGVGIAAGRTLSKQTKAPPLAQVPAPGGGWYTALASVRGRAFAQDGPTNCGHVITPRTFGVAHPVLTCDAKIWIRYRGREVLTQVLATGAPAPGHDFELTTALARLLRLRGTQQLEWRYAS